MATISPFWDTNVPDFSRWKQSTVSSEINLARGQFNKTFTGVIYKVSVAIVLDSENNSYTCKLHRTAKSLIKLTPA